MSYDNPQLIYLLYNIRGLKSDYDERFLASAVNRLGLKSWYK